MTPTLFAQVKRKLNITWSDNDTDARVTDIINDAEQVMIHKLGIENTAFDFSAVGVENMLFLNYCLYAYNHVANEFDGNYWNDIAQCRAKHEVAHYDTGGDDND